MKIHFICYPQGPAESAGYQHEIVSLAEGLTELGASVSGSENYWRNSIEEGDYLIRKSSDIDLDQYQVVVFHSTFHDYRSENLLPKQLFSSDRKFKSVFIDSSDGFSTPGYRPEFNEIDLVLKSHFNRFLKHPKNFVPWAFGLTERMRKYSAPIVFDEREKRILANFRVKHPLRNKVEEIATKYYSSIFEKNEKIDPFDHDDLSDIDRLFWEQSGRRHYPSYYSRLGKSLLCNAVGGYLTKKTYVRRDLFFRVISKFDRKLGILPHDIIYQFDSWRFWESLISGCCTIHIDLKKYGCVLPEMPINGEHYLGIDLSKPQSILPILRDLDRLKDISNNGMAWAEKHYAPKPTAKRFLDLIAEL